MLKLPLNPATHHRDNSDMSQKRIPQGQRTIALAAIAHARANAAEVIGMRPKRERRSAPHSEGIRMHPQPLMGRELDRASEQAMRTWPEDDTWEIFGASDCIDWPDDDDPGGDGCFLEPDVYGEFESAPVNPDVPGWLAS